MQKFGTWPILNDWPLIRSHRLFPWCSNRVMDFEISILARKMNMLVLWFFELPSFCFCQTVVRESLLWVWTFSVSPSTVTHIRGRFRIGFWFDELALNSVSFSLILVRSRTCHTVGQSDSSILAKKWIYINMESIFLNFSWSFMVHHRSTVPYRPRIPIWIILKREFCEKTRKKTIFELDLREKETTRDEL